MALTKIDDRGLKTPIDLLDNEKIRFGTGNDLEIFHDGSNSYIDDTGTGSLVVRSSDFLIRSPASAEVMADFHQNGAVELYYDNAKVFYTTAAGAIVKRPSGGETQFQITGCEGNAAELRLVADDGDDNADYWKIKADTVGSGCYIQNFASGSWEESIQSFGNGAVKLYYDSSTKFETTSSGVAITGNGTFDAAGQNYIRIGSTDASGAILTLDGDSNGDGSGADYCMIMHDTDGHLKIYADNPANAANIQFYSNATTERMRILSNGKVGINTDSPTRLLHVKDTAGGDAQIIVETTANAERAQIEFKSPHATWVTGTFGGNTTGDWLTYTTSDADAIFHQNGSEKFRIKGDGDVSINDGNLDIATAGHGINFGATTQAGGATSELLADYEEGSFTPTLAGGGTSISYSEQLGYYRKIGKTVFVSVRMQFSCNSNSALFSVGGLPFTSAASSGHNYTSGGITYCNVPLDSADFDPYIGNNVTYISFYEKVTGNSVVLSSNANNNYIGVGAFFFTDS